MASGRLAAWPQDRRCASHGVCATRQLGWQPATQVRFSLFTLQVRRCQMQNRKHVSDLSGP